MRQSDIRSMRRCRIARRSIENGYSCLYIAVDGKLAGLVPYSDEIRAESRPVIQQLHALGVKHTIMLTGDNAWSRVRCAATSD